MLSGFYRVEIGIVGITEGVAVGRLIGNGADEGIEVTTFRVVPNYQALSQHQFGVNPFGPQVFRAEISAHFRIGLKKIIYIKKIEVKAAALEMTANGNVSREVEPKIPVPV